MSLASTVKMEANLGLLVKAGLRPYFRIDVQQHMAIFNWKFGPKATFNLLVGSWKEKKRNAPVFKGGAEQFISWYQKRINYNK